MNKFEFVKKILNEFLPKDSGKRLHLLDVGCRGCDLKEYVSDAFHYEGLDLFQNTQGTVNHVLDVSFGLPFPDNGYEIVVALDLLEHLDDLNFGLTELTRISKDATLIMLPNMAHVFFRWNFLVSGRLSDKYDLIFGYGKDRHRWLTVLNQSDLYMQNFAINNHLDIDVYYFNDTKKKEQLGRICRILGIQPKHWAWSSLYVLKNRKKGS